MPQDRLQKSKNCLVTPRDPRTKEYAEFRDRAAYVYVTGSFPTHLRTYFTALLRAVTSYHLEPASLDKRLGNIHIEKPIAEQLHLDEHPMVRKVRQLINDGFIIERSATLTDRRPYGRVRMVKDTKRRIVVQGDGSVRDL